MRERKRRLWFLIATLPGVAVPFAPFASRKTPWSEIRRFAWLAIDVDHIGVYLYQLSLLAAFAPLVVVLVDFWRLTERPTPRAISGVVAAFASLIGVSFAAIFLLEALMERDLPFGGLAVGVSGAIALLAGLAVHVYRREVQAVDAAAAGLMGVFALVAAWYVYVYGDLFGRSPYLNSGGYVSLYVCAVFVVRIVDVLRSSRPRLA